MAWRCHTASASKPAVFDCLAKSEIRISKSETNPNIEIPNDIAEFGISDFGFVSDFDIRISDFPGGAMSILDRFRLDGKRLFITGGSRGLGRAMALAIAEAGADVVLVGRDAASLARTEDDIRARTRQAWTIQADAAVPEECERACRDALAPGPI